MTIVETTTPVDTRLLPPLGVIALLRRSASLLRRAFWPLFGSCYVYAAAIQVATVALVSWLVGAGIQPTGLEDSIETGPSAITVVLGVAVGLVFGLVFAVFSGAISHVALKSESGEPASAGEAISVGFRFMLPMFLCFVILSVLIGAGFLAVVVPGLWLIGVYALAPMVMIGDERARGVLGHTRRLTKGYRWPLVGFFALLYIALFAISMILDVFGAIAPVDPANTTPMLLRALLLDAPVGALLTALFFAAFAVAYRRLTEIKDGDAALRTVFE